MRETRSEPVAGDGGPLDQIAPPHQVPPRGGIPVRAWQVPLHRVGEAVVDVEQDAGVDRVLYPIIPDAGGAERGGVGGAPAGGRETRGGEGSVWPGGGGRRPPRGGRRGGLSRWGGGGRCRPGGGGSAAPPASPPPEGEGAWGGGAPTWRGGQGVRTRRRGGQG